jgi:hypothetical protein
MRPKVRRKRKPPTLREELDAALLALMEARGEPMDRETAKGLKVGAVRTMFDFDHWPEPAALGGSNHPSNLWPRLRADHKHKTAKLDIPAIAKVKRISKAHSEFRARILAKSGQGEAQPERRSKWGTRKLNTKGAKLRSRNNLRRKEVTA